MNLATLTADTRRAFEKLTGTTAPADLDALRTAVSAAKDAAEAAGNKRLASRLLSVRRAAFELVESTRPGQPLPACLYEGFAAGHLRSAGFRKLSA